MKPNDETLVPCRRCGGQPQMTFYETKEYLFIKVKCENCSLEDIKNYIGSGKRIRKWAIRHSIKEWNTKIVYEILSDRSDKTDKTQRMI